MAITFSTMDFEKFVEAPTDADFLQWATDLFYLATKIETLPTDPLERRLVERAVFQMGWYLKEDWRNREAYMSGFSSERIGGYSYSKMAKAVEDNIATSVPAFDLAVEYFEGKKNKSSSLVTSEHVFTEPYPTEAPQWVWSDPSARIR